MSLPVQDNFAETAVSQPYPKARTVFVVQKLEVPFTELKAQKTVRGIGIIEITK